MLFRSLHPRQSGSLNHAGLATSSRSMGPDPRSSLLINGGAAVAVLGFVASISSAEAVSGKTIDGVADALMWFAWGAVGSAVGLALAYFTNYAALWANNRTASQGQGGIFLLKRAIHMLAILCATSTMVFFVLGTLAVRAAIRGVLL